jgi:NADH:ubiquinone oxidoreductase subunit 4 (subunit M)
MACSTKMKIRAAVALGFAVKIPVFDVHAHGQAHVASAGNCLPLRDAFRSAG